MYIANLNVTEPIKDNETLIHYLDSLIDHAFQLSVSDIHIEPGENLYHIRYRQHGILHHVTELTPQLASRLIMRLKVMAQLDITERRLPQDGRLQINLLSQEVIDIRISICSMLLGEKVVLRLITRATFLLPLSNLGFNLQQKNILLEKINQTQGLILITGPTGSGKTSTLYSVLHQLNKPEKNIITIEDPIELQLAGINQIHLNIKIGLSFATVLRAVLRQDPDILMIGEIRDRETAEIAIQAAQTGHLVLSTLHTNNSFETISRLRLMGCKPYHLVNALSLIITQRLVRLLCPCQINFGKNPQCNQCYQGFLGRTGIFECLPITENMRSQIIKNTNTNMLLKTAQKEGFISLKEAGLIKVNQGETSMAELLRVL